MTINWANWYYFGQNSTEIRKSHKIELAENSTCNSCNEICVFQGIAGLSIYIYFFLFTLDWRYSHQSAVVFGSTVIAAVGEADQQMLFATQEGKN